MDGGGRFWVLTLPELPIGNTLFTFDGASAVPCVSFAAAVAIMDRCIQTWPLLPAAGERPH